MPDREIQTYLDSIANARYGEQVRSAIYNAIECCYDDTQDGITRAESSVSVILDGDGTSAHPGVYSLATDMVSSVVNNWQSSYITPWINRMEGTPNGWFAKLSAWETTFGGWDTSFTAWSNYFSLENNESWLNKFNSWASSYTTMMGSATTAIESAEAQALSASNAAASAEMYTNAFANLSVTSETIYGSTPMSVTFDRTSSPWTMTFYLKKGDPGTSYMIKGGPFSTLEALEEAITDPQEGDCYEVGSSPSAPPYNVYRWTGSTWNLEGTISTTPISNDILDDYWASSSPDSGNEGLFLNGRGLTYLIVNKLRTAFTNFVSKEYKDPSQPALGYKVLSDNNFSNTWISTINNNTNDIVNKVSKAYIDSSHPELGYKVLSDENYTSSEKIKLSNINAGSSAPLMAGTASCGTSLNYSREDHVHPWDTNQILYFTNQPVSAASSATIATITDSKITDDMVVLSCKFADEKYVLSDVNWVSSSGFVSFTGTTTATTTMDVVLGRKGN